MFCKSCGTKLSNDFKFCSVCGTPLEYNLDKNSVMNKDLSDYVGKNSSYFSEEFEKVKNGKPSKFNRAAFFFNIIYCLYRKQYSIIWRYFKIPLILTVFINIAYPIYLMIVSIDLFSLAMISTVVQITYVFIQIWSIISAIMVGKNFNRLYYENLINNIEQDKEIEEYTGVSWKNVFLFLAIVVLFSSLTNIMLRETILDIYERELGVHEGYSMVESCDIIKTVKLQI